MITVEKVCLICEAPFTVSAHREKTATTCSPPCRGKWIAKRYADQRVAIVCKGCGNTFYVPACHQARRVYCSKSCASPSRKGCLKGEDHYRWEGGKKAHTAGYLYISVHGQPLGGSRNYVFEHRIVMETWMRESVPDHRFLIEIDGVGYLDPKIHVHHINHMRSDNRRENLLACTVPAHHSIHAGNAPMFGEIWPEIKGALPFKPYRVERTCVVCGKVFMTARSNVKRGNVKFCTRECYNLRSRASFPIFLQ